MILRYEGKNLGIYNPKETNFHEDLEYLIGRKCREVETSQDLKLHKVFDQNWPLLIHRRVTGYQIRDFNFSQKLGCTLFSVAVSFFGSNSETLHYQNFLHDNLEQIPQ